MSVDNALNSSVPYTDPKKKNTVHPCIRNDHWYCIVKSQHLYIPQQVHWEAATRVPDDYVINVT